MWAAVRFGAALDDPGTLLRPRASLPLVWLLVALPGMLFAAVPVIVILTALGLFYVAERIVLATLRCTARRDTAGEPLKAINEPKFPWTPEAGSSPDP